MTTPEDAGIRYVGTELELFATATRWKTYLRDVVAPYLGARVLEVGAGLGHTTQILCRGSAERWVCLEPDPRLASKIEERCAAGDLPGACAVRVGTTADVAGDLTGSFDSVIYIDVLEHIEDDRREVATAARLLRPGGRLVVMSPAHQSLYTPFDRAIGHFRRYDRASLTAIAGDDLALERMIYLDSVGLLASSANRFFLRQSMPTSRQIATWDRLMIPASRLLDPLLAFTLGKSILGVWKKRDGEQPRLAASS
jgi:SAM-dependent methyltransferase